MTAEAATVGITWAQIAMLVGGVAGISTVIGAGVTWILKAREAGRSEGEHRGDRDARIRTLEERVAALEKKREDSDRIAAAARTEFELLRKDVLSALDQLRAIAHNVNVLLFGRNAANQHQASPTGIFNPAPQKV